MLNRILRYILPPFGFRTYYRRIFYSKQYKVPMDKPLLFAGNHPNSFMDGMMVGAYLGQTIHFLMRADMFRNPVGAWCLKELNVAPVYRVQEGLENVHKNLDTFDAIYELLRRNENLIVFSEGISVQKRRLLNLKKGIGRMAFGAEEKYDADVYVVPVGLNYTNPPSFRGELMISFGDAIRLKDLKDDYAENPAKGLLTLNRKIEASLKEEVVIIEEPSNDELGERILQMVRNGIVHPFFKWFFTEDDRRVSEKEACDKLNNLTRTSPGDLAVLRQKVDGYFDKLKKGVLSDKNFAARLNMGFLRYLAVLIWFPFYIAGLVLNILPFTVPRILVGSLIKNPVFYSSTYVAVGTVLYLIYFPVVVILGVVFLGWWGLLLLPALPVLGYASLLYQELFTERFWTFMYQVRKLFNRKLVEELKEQRKEIFDLLGRY